MGQVTLAWDDEQTSREALLEAMAQAGFRERRRRLAPERRESPAAPRR